MASKSEVVIKPTGLPREAFLAVGATVTLAAVAATFFDQTRGLISVLASATLVLAYFVGGLLTERIALQYPDSTGITITLASYAVRVGLLGVILWWAMSTPLLSDRLIPLWVAVGALGALLAWTSGLMWWHSRARIPIYDRPYEAPAGWDDED